MSEMIQESALCQAFACYRVESPSDDGSFSVESHSHYFSEVMLMRSGTCRVIRGSYTYILKPGELIYISPLVRHSVESVDGSPVVYDVVKFSATRLREIPSYLSDLHSFSMDAAHAHLSVHMNSRDVETWHLDKIIMECISECERRAFAWDLHVRALICLLITGLSRFWLSRRETMADYHPHARDPILDIPAYIEQHISEPLKVEDLAAQCGLSYPWFAKRFREFFGLSCKQFIQQLRNEAVELYLVYSDLDLACISDRTGYTDCSHMVKEFRRMTGTTPGQYRSMMKIQGHSHFIPFSRQAASIHPSKG